jgi:hypothetical protein
MDYLEVYDRYICKSLIAGFADFQKLYDGFWTEICKMQNSGWLFIWKGDSENDPTKTKLALSLSGRSRYDSRGGRERGRGGLVFCAYFPGFLAVD